MKKKESQKRRLVGTVVSAKMQKTVVVKVDRVKVHEKYGKRFTLSSRFKADDGGVAYAVGDIVVIEETRPVSRDKRWRVIEKHSEKKA